MVPFNWVVSVPNHFDSFIAQLGEVTPEVFQRIPSAGMKLVVSLDFVDRHYLKMCQQDKMKRIAGPNKYQQHFCNIFGLRFVCFLDFYCS